MDARTIAIGLVVLAVLLPTWFAALQSPGEHPGEVEIDTSETDMRPLQSILETPAEFTPAQVGVIIWIALGALSILLAVFHRFMHGPGTTEPDTEASGEGVRSWFQTDSRWIVDFVAAEDSADGLWVILATIAATVAFAVLTIIEFSTLARTQYVGLYVAGMFLTLALGVAAYSAWFMPHVVVAEERYHG
ncbi:MAG: hypothetical protein U5K70_06815 [Halodesulfurarchaeum sp.]|nr:hypothetical protein [Halodesulfurarchaeum sp.]